MKSHILYFIVLLALVISPIAVSPAQALSCLPIDMYLKDVVGKEEIVIFTGTSVEVTETTNYTSEVLTVTDVKQGYVEEKIFVYHQRHSDWGYLCNTGPKEKGSKGLYVAGRDAFGKYNVHQRLELNDPLIKALEDNLKKADVEGVMSESSATDRVNQIMTTISDMLREIGLLLKEYAYWKTQD